MTTGVPGTPSSLAVAAVRRRRLRRLLLARSRAPASSGPRSPARLGSEEPALLLLPPADA